MLLARAPFGGATLHVRLLLQANRQALPKAARPVVAERPGLTLVLSVRAVVTRDFRE